MAPTATRSRGAPVVRAVIEATLDELARVGYAALTFEDVAIRAGVNRTTIYRRWASRPELVKAALGAMAESVPPLEESGEVARDLLAIARRTRDVLSSRHGRGIARMLLGGCIEPELVALAAQLRRAYEAPARTILERARARGALRPDGDPGELMAAIGGWVTHVLFREEEAVTDERLAAFVTLLLDGAAARTGDRAGERAPARYALSDEPGQRRSGTR